MTRTTGESAILCEVGERETVQRARRRRRPARREQGSGPCSLLKLVFRLGSIEGFEQKVSHLVCEYLHSVVALRSSFSVNIISCSHPAPPPFPSQ